ncbi:MAG: LacI family DNA-binding transcriptional regulator [Capsulimonadaceae bacterium]|nr:LacI family DNA-binding transcriptional regulator [Capsulimonadaceae bacterium]
MPGKNTTERVTLRHVAELANVSIASTSTVLSGLTNSTRVPKATSDRIWAAARTLGYEKRGHGSGGEAGVGPKRRLLHVGVITEYDAALSSPAGERNPWGHDVSTALELKLSEQGAARVSYFNRRVPNAPPVPVDEAASALLSKNVDALVLVYFGPSTLLTDQIPVFEAAGVPYVFVSPHALSAPVANIYYDNRAAGFAAGMHLIEMGHRGITFLAPVDPDWASARIEGVADAIRAFRLPPDTLNVYPGERPQCTPAQLWTTADGYAGAVRTIAEAGIVSGQIAPAVIALNDEAALAFLDVVRAAGRAADFAVMGFDDMPEARFEGLTTLRPPREAMGREAADLILKMCRRQKARKQICLLSDLVARASTLDVEQRTQGG